MKSIVCVDHVSPNYISASRLFMALTQAVAREVSESDCGKL